MQKYDKSYKKSLNDFILINYKINTLLHYKNGMIICRQT